MKKITFAKAQITEFSNSKGEYLAKIKILMSLGFPTNDDKTAEEYADRWYGSYPIIGISSNKIGAWSNKISVTIKFTELVTACLNQVAAPDISIKLNDEYTAIIKGDTEIVEVGCQNIPFSKIEEVYKAIQAQKAAQQLVE